MKSFKKVLHQLLTLSVVLTMFLALGLVGEAASAKVPSKVRVYPGNAYNSGAISVKYGAAGDTIKKLKSSSKNLIVKWTNHNSNTAASADSEYENRGTISLYAKKKGTYTVTFDVYKADGKKRSSHKVKVYAYTDSAIKSIKVNGKSQWGLLSSSSAKVKITMNPGYKLKKLEYGVNTIKKSGNNWRTETTYKKFSNGGKIKLNAKGYYYYNSYKYESSYDPSSSYSSLNWEDSLIADTSIKVTYVDKYTKQQTTTYIGLSRLNTKKSR